MKKIAILASDNMMPSALAQRDDSHERDEQIEKTIPSLSCPKYAFGYCKLEVGCLVKLSIMTQYFPLFVWDYFDDNEMPSLLKKWKRWMRQLICTTL